MAGKFAEPTRERLLELKDIYRKNYWPPSFDRGFRVNRRDQGYGSIPVQRLLTVEEIIWLIDFALKHREGRKRRSKKCTG